MSRIVRFEGRFTEITPYIKSIRSTLRQGDVLVRTYYGTHHTAVWYGEDGLDELGWDVGSCLIPYSCTKAHDNAFAYFAATMNELMQVLKIPASICVKPTDSGVDEHVGYVDPRWVSVTKEFRRCGTSKTAPFDHVYTTSFTVRVADTIEFCVVGDRLDREICDRQTAEALRPVYEVAVLCNTPISERILTRVPDGHKTAHINTNLGPVRPGTRVWPGAPVVWRRYRYTYTVFWLTAAAADALQSRLERRFRHVVVLRPPPDHLLVKDTSSKRSRVHLSSSRCAADKPPHQHSFVVSVALVLTECPTYELVEVLVRLDELRYWTRFELVNLVNRVRASVARVTDARVARAVQRRLQ